MKASKKLNNKKKKDMQGIRLESKKESNLERKLKGKERNQASN